jgi:phytoene dehydrogenase-like protein
MADPVIVIGGGLAGLAAAARLAKAGHAVELYEQSDRLGGSWAPYELESGITVDDAPSVIGFPAPWRDLFRKSGRPLEAELARIGYALAPAGPPTMIFGDGAQLTLPADRAGQHSALTDAYGRSVADRWQQLIDRFGEVWQTLRGLGFEAELRDRRQLNRTARRSLFGPSLFGPGRFGQGSTVADLATSIDSQHLAALLRSVAYRSGSRPEHTPAFAAVELYLMRTFGRWQVQPLEADARLDAGRSSVLVEALAARLALRKVAVHLGCRIESVTVRNRRATAVVTSDGERPAAAVVATCDPWQTFNELLPLAAVHRIRRGLRELNPAAAPTITHQQVPKPAAPVTETVTLSETGVPTVDYLRQAAESGIRTVHECKQMFPRPSYGVAWNGFGSWLRRPPVTTGIFGLYTAGPFSPAGPSASHVVLSAALAAYGCQDYLGAAHSTRT